MGWGTDGGLAEEVAEKARQRACAHDGSARIVNLDLACFGRCWCYLAIPIIAIAITHVWCWQTATHTTFERGHVVCSALAQLRASVVTGL